MLNLLHCSFVILSLVFQVPRTGGDRGLEPWLIALLVIGLIALIIGVAIAAVLGKTMVLRANSKTGEDK